MTEQLTKQYHRMFINIEPNVVQLVKATIKRGLFKKAKSIEERKEILKNLHEQLCLAYQLPIINIIYNENLERELIFGQYNTIDNEITLKNISLVTYLHEFYHYRQHSRNEENTEDGARGWSISLYYLATPILCRSAIQSGKIVHQTKFIDIENGETKKKGEEDNGN